MKIYTRTGDKGSTQVYAAETLRVEKNDAILQSYGDLDELNCHLGLLAVSCADDVRQSLYQIQRNLFQVGFAVSASSTLTEQDTTALESAIDSMSASLPSLTSFTLPGGCHAGAQAHVCRSVCRRAERSLVTLGQHHSVPASVLAYLNRLSDYLFTLARKLNYEAGSPEQSV